MIQRLLLRLGYPTIRLRNISDRLADSMIDEYGNNYNLLSEGDTKDLLRTRYMRLALRYGLPDDHDTCRRVADMAWTRIHRYTPAEVDARHFSFYN
jgi:hypothetical protein